jgi:serine/threonine protein kinase
MMRMLTFDP